MSSRLLTFSIGTSFKAVETENVVDVLGLTGVWVQEQPDSVTRLSRPRTAFTWRPKQNKMNWPTFTLVKWLAESSICTDAQRKKLQYSETALSLSYISLRSLLLMPLVLVFVLVFDNCLTTFKLLWLRCELRERRIFIGSHQNIVKEMFKTYQERRAES